MSAVSIPVETENLLLYLLTTHMKSARTIDGLRAQCPGDADINDVLNWLIDSGYVYLDDDTFELSVTGLRIARQIQTRSQSRQLGMAEDDPADEVSAVKTAVFPTLETHPLRAGAEHPHHPDAGQRETLRYMLASEKPRNILPIPVLNGDILGRLNDVDISLPYDEFLSGEHCRFTLGVDEGRAALYVEDLDSRNGTYISGRRLEPGLPFRLEHGDRIHVGNTILIVVKIPA